MLSNLKTRRYILLALMLLSILFPVVVFITSSYGARIPLENKLVSIFGYAGVMILLWQYLLGIRFIAARALIDLVWVNKLHQTMGIYGSLIIFAHPIVLFVTRGIARYLPNLTDFSSPRQNYILLGQIALLIVLSTWFGSAFMRRKISYRTWKRLHLINYVILPLALIHALNIGAGVEKITAIQTYFVVVVVVYILALTTRLLAQLLAVGKQRVVLSSNTQLTHDVRKLTFNVAEDSILLTAKPGQFLYLQVKTFGESHPFTMALVDQENSQVSIMPKNSGPFSSYIHTLTEGSEVYLDGPYGVFTNELNNKDTAVRTPVFIAGGIGITPFVRHIRSMASENNSFALFYANKTETDIVLKDEFEKYAQRNKHMTYVPVISNQGEYLGEKGYVTAELIKKYLPDNLEAYTFYICGPVPMLKSVTNQLLEAGVDHSQIFSEKFSL